MLDRQLNSVPLVEIESAMEIELELWLKWIERNSRTVGGVARPQRDDESKRYILISAGTMRPGPSHSSASCSSACGPSRDQSGINIGDY